MMPITLLSLSSRDSGTSLNHRVTVRQTARFELVEIAKWSYNDIHKASRFLRLGEPVL